jgi:hypothetical protein
MRYLIGLLITMLKSNIPKTLSEESQLKITMKKPPFFIVLIMCILYDWIMKLFDSEVLS